MIHSVTKRFIIIYSAIKALFLGLFSIFNLFQENPILKTIFNFALLLIICWLAGFFIYLSSIDKSWNQIVKNHSNIEEKTDAIIVLTGGSERIRNALHLMKKDYAQKLFISGVNKKVKLPELFAIHKVEREDFFKLLTRIELGFEAHNTIQNALEIKGWLEKNPQYKSIRVVTSNYHITRAKNEIENVLNDDVKIISHPVLPVNVRFDKWWKYSGTRNLLITEYNKLIASYFRIFLENLSN